MKIMYKLTTMMELLKRMRRKHELAAVAMAALLFLSALPATATAQDTSTNTYTGSTVVYGGAIGLVPGQTLVISVPNVALQDGSVKFLKSSTVRVYGVTERESGLVYSGESGGVNELGHTFTIKYGDLPVPGEARTERKEVWLEVESTTFSTSQVLGEDTGVGVSPPNVELVDDANGRTVVFGLLLPTQVQGVNVDPGFRFKGGVSVGLASGQTLRLSMAAVDRQGRLIIGTDQGIYDVETGAALHLKVFNGSTGALLLSRELTTLTAGLYPININRDDLREEGQPGTGRIQLRIEVVIDPCSASLQEAEECGVRVSAPTFEVVDNNGRTTVRMEASGPMKESMETMKKAWKDS